MNEELKLWRELNECLQVLIFKFQELKANSELYEKDIVDFQRKAYAFHVPLLELAKDVETVYRRKLNEVANVEK